MAALGRPVSVNLRDFLLQTAPQAFPGWYERLAADCLAPFHEALVEQLQALPAGARVLDDGCGSGRLARLLAARRPDLHIVGTDVSDHLLMRAEEKAREEGVAERIRFECVAADTKKAPGGPFDAVAAAFTLYCQQDDPARALERWYRSLRAGGTCLVLEAVRDHAPTQDAWSEDRLAMALRARNLTPRWLPMKLLIPTLRDVRARLLQEEDLDRLIQDSPFGTCVHARRMDACLGEWRVAGGVRLLTLRSAEVESRPERG